MLHNFCLLITDKLVHALLGLSCFEVVLFFVIVDIVLLLLLIRKINKVMFFFGKNRRKWRILVKLVTCSRFLQAHYRKLVFLIVRKRIRNLSFWLLIAIFALRVTASDEASLFKLYKSLFRVSVVLTFYSDCLLAFFDHTVLFWNWFKKKPNLW